MIESKHPLLFRFYHELTCSLNYNVNTFMEVLSLDFMTVVCDIKQSSSLENREEVQYKLIEMLKDTNSRFSTSIAAPFIITIGDEWQGLLNYPCDHLTILNHFHKTMDTIDFYCGIGIGPISVHNFELTVNQLDGPSFYKARRAIRLAKRFKYSIVMIQ